jgi:hypothetical protein
VDNVVGVGLKTVSGAKDKVNACNVMLDLSCTREVV